MSREAAILVVDDRKENLVMISAVLDDEDYRVVTAASGAEALKKIASEDFALVLLDLRMPILNGLETARLIRERPLSKDTPIIFVTAYEGEAKTVYEAYDSGAVDYIEQPINPRILKSKIRIFVEFYLQKKELQTIRQNLEDEVRRQIAAFARTNEELQREIAIREKVEERLLHESSYDVLTGLPNRQLFLRAMQRCFQSYKRDASYSFAVLFVDIDNFKAINDQHGHIIGDQVLIESAHRLEYAIRPGDIVSRFGGDEFAVLLDRVNTEFDAEAITKRIMGRFARAFEHEKENLLVSLSIGIAMFSPEYETPEDMLRGADAAMYSSKASGKSNYCFTTTPLNTSATPAEEDR